MLVKDVGDQVAKYGSLNKVPAEVVGNTRNDMYLTSEAIRFLMKDKENDLSKEEVATLNAYKGALDSATKFIPTWVKVAVAIALGLGTMVGWKRIVVTVGEKIGKTHLTYAQGASAELVAAATIGAADVFGLPVSTTHVLSSGVAGTMAANGSGLQVATIRNMADGLGADAAGRDPAVGHAVRDLLADLLKTRSTRHPRSIRREDVDGRALPDRGEDSREAPSHDNEPYDAASVFSTSLIQYDVPYTIASSLKL